MISALNSHHSAQVTYKKSLPKNSSITNHYNFKVLFILLREEDPIYQLPLDPKYPPPNISIKVFSSILFKSMLISEKRLCSILTPR